MDGPKSRSDERSPDRRILVADVCEDSAQMMRILLRQQGYEVKLAFSGQELIEVTRSFRPEVLLLDLGLPEGDVYEIASRLRHEEPFRHATMIAVSGSGRGEEPWRSKEAGFDYYFVKPLDFDLLLSLLTPAE